MSAAINMDTFQIGLSAWIIQDGNYGDFSVGQEATFALEFYPRSLSLAQPGTPRLDSIGPARYSILGRVDFVASKAWVVDFGLRASQEAACPPGILPQSWVQGEVYLGIDPFYYFERLHDLPGMPALSYKWVIRNIRLETTPWITTEKTSVRDESKTSFKDVQKTDAWDDDEGCAHYILECERLDWC